MVRSLGEIVALNNKARGKPEEHRKIKVPEEIALKPAAARRFVNRPWRKDELAKGEKCPYESYAESAAAPFKGKEGEVEGIRE